ncbi:MAG: PAS domain-containing protein, partial [Verrucomicrobiota bacterium]|nr:PAS domain-containing protein [Verrucomicrobiota bacterium]
MTSPTFRVLLIEDQPDEAESIRRLLEGAGPAYQLTASAGTLQEGLAAIRAGGLDLILLDLDLPDGDGLAAFKAVCAHAHGVPIIVLSGEDNEQIAFQIVHGGAQDSLVKAEIDSRMLARSIRYAVERANTERELSHERELLRNVLDNILDPIYVKDASGKYTISNLTHARRIGKQSEAEVVGRTVFDFFPEHIASKFHRDDLGVIQSGETVSNFEEMTVNADGQQRWILSTKVPLRDEAGKIWGLVGIARDITEEKRAQENMVAANDRLFMAVSELQEAHAELRNVQLQLIESEKLKSIGRLAAGVAHEVKNPLAIITMGIDYLAQQNFGEDNAIPIILQDMGDAVHRADAVIKGLLDFSAPKRLELVPEDLNAIIERALLLVRGEMLGSFDLLRELQPDLPLLRIDGMKIEQVFVNLLTNAIHAMSEAGGTLTVRTFSRQLTGVGENIGDRRSESFRVGDVVVVAEVEDTGIGIPAAQLTKIYDPFFTTKPTGKGTGLGLTVTRTIV